MARQVTPQRPLTPAAEARIAAIAHLAYDRAMRSSFFERDALAFDRQTLRRFDVDGRMHVERCNISKANVCPYYGREIPGYAALGLDPNRIYRLYRDPAELARAADSFRNLQLLMMHTPVNAADPRTEVTVGTIGSDVRFEAPYLVASVAVWTAEAIALIESKQQAQLSSSYRYRPDMTPGTTPEGVAYDGVMRDIMGNHVALVEEGRAGPDVYVSDSKPTELQKMKRPALVAAVLAALTHANVTVSDEAKVAMDAALDEAACKAEDEAEEERKKKAAEDASKPVQAGPSMGERGAALDGKTLEAAVDEAIAARGLISKDDATKLANDSAAAAVAAERALHKARKDVEPLVGIIAMDSAEAVYRFALDRAGVALDGIDPSAFGALVDQVKKGKTAPVVPPALAADASNSVVSSIPGLGRIARG